MLASWWRHGKPGRHQEEAAPTDELLPIRALYLRRLYRLVLLDARPALTDEERRLVNHALDATYRACISVGARQQARAMLGLPHRK